MKHFHDIEDDIHTLHKIYLTIISIAGPLLVVALIMMLTGCAHPNSRQEVNAVKIEFSPQLIVYQRGGTASNPRGNNETLSETATEGGGSPTLEAKLP